MKVEEVLVATPTQPNPHIPGINNTGSGTSTGRSFSSASLEDNFNPQASNLLEQKQLQDIINITYNHDLAISAAVPAPAPALEIHPTASTPEKSSPTRRSNRKITQRRMADVQDAPREGSDDEEPAKKTGKSRRELPAGAVATLKAWLLSPEHFTHPYPTPQDQLMLMQKTGIDKKQLKNWFTNARRRIWKPMLKKQLEQGKIAQTGSGGVVTIPGATPGLMAAPAPGTDYAPSPQIVNHTQSIQQNYQNALQQAPTSQQQYDQYGNPTFVQQPPAPSSQNQFTNGSNYNYQQNQFSQQQVQGQGHNDSITQSGSIATLPTMPGSTPPGSTTNLNKTDSHAVLMELFARDQDLVRQATKERNSIAPNANGGTTNVDQTQDGASNAQKQQSGMGSQHPMSSKITGGSMTQNKLGNVTSLNSWPHFSSVSSLNNLGTMTGVKSITNMSGVDLASRGSKGNLARVMSRENSHVCRADSYAFLEVFFDTPGSGSGQTQRGTKRGREEDDENVGLSLDGDDGASPTATGTGAPVDNPMRTNAPVAAPLPIDGEDKLGLKRAYDDALAARGLISVSRSSEKLSDLALPAKMQRTISQEYLKSMTAGGSTTFTTFSFNSNVSQPAPVVEAAPGPTGSTHAPLVHPASQSQTQQFPSQLAPTRNFENNTAPTTASSASPW